MATRRRIIIAVESPESISVIMIYSKQVIITNASIYIISKRGYHYRCNGLIPDISRFDNFLSNGTVNGCLNSWYSGSFVRSIVHPLMKSTIVIVFNLSTISYLETLTLSSLFVNNIFTDSRIEIKINFLRNGKLSKKRQILFSSRVFPFQKLNCDDLLKTATELFIICIFRRTFVMI